MRAHFHGNDFYFYFSVLFIISLNFSDHCSYRINLPKVKSLNFQKKKNFTTFFRCWSFFYKLCEWMPKIWKFEDLIFKSVLLCAAFLKVQQSNGKMSTNVKCSFPMIRKVQLIGREWKYSCSDVFQENSIRKNVT